MKVHPVRRYPTPRFPTRAILSAHPELLRLVPKRWRRNPVVLAGLALACGVTTLRWTGRHGALASHVAPIFQHGDGRGAFGCVATNPPVFLTEAEARQVVAEEARKAGITFQPDAHSLWGVAQPITSSEPRATGMSVQPASTLTPFVLDGVDRRRRVAYEFVSKEDLAAWESRAPSMYVSSVSVFDVRGAAEALHKGIRVAGPVGAYAVFYDPAVGSDDGRKALGSSSAGPSSATDWNQEGERADTAAKQLAREELRRQVRDFVQWLKGQGVI